MPVPGTSKVVWSWIAVSILASLAAHASGGWMLGVLAYEPDRVLRGELWRLATWVFVDESLTRIVVTCLMLHHFGRALAERWGDPALRRYALVVLGGAAIATTLLAVVLPPVLDTLTIGGWSVRYAILIGWARQFPDHTVLLFDIPVMTGKRLVPCILVAVVGFALINGLLTSLPELLTCAAACGYPLAQRAARHDE